LLRLKDSKRRLVFVSSPYILVISLESSYAEIYKGKVVSSWESNSYVKSVPDSYDLDYEQFTQVEGSQEVELINC